jgi:hypothetical protein
MITLALTFLGGPASETTLAKIRRHETVATGQNV